MKHQQVSVDYWVMAKTMLTYGALTVLGWFMFRLFNAVFTLPRRLRTQQQNIQDTLKEFQRRCPDLNITEEDLKEAEKEFEEWAKEADQKLKDNGKPETAVEGNSADEKSDKTTNVEKKISI